MHSYIHFLHGLNFLAVCGWHDKVNLISCFWGSKSLHYIWASRWIGPCSKSQMFGEVEMSYNNWFPLLGKRVFLNFFLSESGEAKWWQLWKEYSRIQKASVSLVSASGTPSSMEWRIWLGKFTFIYGVSSC